MAIVMTGAALLGLFLFCAASYASEGVAVAIVYDTSGSMREAVRDGKGGRSPKYVIGNRALEAMVRKIEQFATNNPTKPVHVGLFTFSGNGATEVVKFGKFDPDAMRRWIQNYRGPESGTPLGAALKTAGETVMKSDLSQKHVLVITDGQNTVGPDPTRVLPQILRDAQKKNAILFTHFVAFDVAASVFAPLKQQGATVVGANNETELNQQLDFILEEKILLEKETKK
jgi:Mg-chelatase subunit ChlD